MRKFAVSIGTAMLCFGLAGTATAASYSYPGDAQPITDGVWTYADIDVGGLSGLVTDVNVFVDIIHSSVGDLEIYLDHSLDGGITWKSVQLFNHELLYYTLPNGTGTYLYNSLNNISSVLFDDQAAMSISDDDAVAPYGPGSYQPTSYPYDGVSNSLAYFFGDPAGGMWSLSVYDNASGDIGTLEAFRVDIETSSVPLPGAVVLFGSGLSVLVTLRRSRKK